MKLISRCPICGGQLMKEDVEKLLRGGSNVASIEVRAGVCHKCGEIVYDAVTVRKFQEIREKLEQNEVADFSLLGKAYVVN
ncbi:MAG: YgiT-type zinc finger domain-containing protein [Candidatus Fraserbacteria bacterium RBG_16_55_9]|uniref:YgiT-type zinc finger domain-containing protein n=1 Tax=Fraserbacteria sp. (strain RBG_16_55_9) TaxID=1817864 RepID=A0A1F5V185_FRAXR|nr:MAG: YgiT-type zinc finger domain-containing protein [Candidatus Fraserbacteria bacterium RBG_16_55_9]